MIPTRATLRKNIYAALFAAMVTLTPSWVYADSVMMVRLERAFPEAMNVLQEAINGRGYRDARSARRRGSLLTRLLDRRIPGGILRKTRGDEATA